MEGTPDPSTHFDRQLAAFVVGAQAVINEHTARNFPNLTPAQLTVEDGPERHKRIVATHFDERHTPTRTAWAFVDDFSGEIYPSKSWNEPAPNPRGSIFDSDCGISNIGPHGPGSAE